MFAKEAIVGTLDALYTEPSSGGSLEPPEFIPVIKEAISSIGAELAALGGALTDPLGISIGDGRTLMLLQKSKG